MPLDQIPAIPEKPIGLTATIRRIVCLDQTIEAKTTQKDFFMFQVGDTVQLKSGGPMMTVTKTGTRADGVFVVVCTWFDGGGEKNQTSFPPGSGRRARCSQLSLAFRVREAFPRQPGAASKSPIKRVGRKLS